MPSEILHFGEAPLMVVHGRLLRHETTDGILYRHHQARHLAIVADGSKVQWSLAADGSRMPAPRRQPERPATR